MKTDLSALNDQQTEAVVSDDKRLLVLAGAGSGKTKTLLQKIVYLIEEMGITPSSILAITFTKNSTNEMIDRLIISADKTKRYESILTDKRLSKIEKDKERFLNLSRPDLGLHELTCKQDDKIRKNSSGTRGYHCRVFAGRYDLS
jgi:ATP-dependent exoDNAse (exonuclease V) beta subunit